MRLRKVRIPQRHICTYWSVHNGVAVFLPSSSITTMFKTRRDSQAGFTLIELLVVIAIIGLLSSVVLASLNGARERARDARRLADMQQLRVALELYYSANNRYPNYST